MTIAERFQVSRSVIVHAMPKGTRLSCVLKSTSKPRTSGRLGTCRGVEFAALREMTTIVLTSQKGARQKGLERGGEFSV